MISGGTESRHKLHEWRELLSGSSLEDRDLEEWKVVHKVKRVVETSMMPLLLLSQLYNGSFLAWQHYVTIVFVENVKSL